MFAQSRWLEASLLRDIVMFVAELAWVLVQLAAITGFATAVMYLVL